jgi:signal transduction histidine kinase
MRDDMVPYRLYEFTVPDATGNTRVVLKHILLEPQALIVWLFGYTALIMLLLALGIFLINQRVYRWAFRPFFTNLTRIRSYDLGERKKVDWETTDIEEFAELNRVISLLMDRVEKDYENLKELNENIAHEIQTPLAVVRNKAVNLLDSSSMNEDQLKQVKTIYDEANRLSRIGKSLTLISRIDNQEFLCSDSIDVRGMTLEILGDLEEMISYRKLRVDHELEEVWIEGDAELSRILLINLIKNAIQHNEDGGEIRISLTAEALTITNTGPPSQIPPEKLFTRFSRSPSHTSGLGLGLAICKKISALCFMDLGYRNTDNLHHFELRFNAV